MKAPESLRQMIISAGLLAGFAMAGSLLLGLTETGTREHIQANERAYLINSLNQVLPPDQYDNDLLHDTLTITAPEAFGRDEPVTVYVARRENKPVAALFTVIAPEGYSGDIKLLVGIYRDGTLAGVRAVAHRETPGLGDAIEADRSDWIKGFSGLSLNNPAEKAWRVRKDGGVFDAFTGATITPRAVIKAVKKALIYFNGHRQAFFETEDQAVVSETGSAPEARALSPKHAAQAAPQSVLEKAVDKLKAQGENSHKTPSKDLRK